MLSDLPVRLLIAACVGIPAGVGGYTFIYAKGASYLTNDPNACANCHVMQDHLDAWTKSSHRSVAMCNDCHTPKNLVAKYATKAENGFWHSLKFTTGDFKNPIQIRPHNKAIAEHSCLKCHAAIVDQIAGPHAAPAGHGKRGEEMSCTRCHSGVGHPMPGGAAAPGL